MVPDSDVHVYSQDYGKYFFATSAGYTQVGFPWQYLRSISNRIASYSLFPDYREVLRNSTSVVTRNLHPVLTRIAALNKLNDSCIQIIKH